MSMSMSIGMYYAATHKRQDIIVLGKPKESIQNELKSNSNNNKKKFVSSVK